MPVNDQDYALVIGIDDYPDYSPLKGAKTDAERFADWLTDTATGGGLPTGNCKRLFSPLPASPPPTDKLATYGNIDDALFDIHEGGKDTGKRRLYFYFSGHGQTLTSGEVNMCLSKWAMKRARMALSYQSWRETIFDCTGFSEVFFFFDCCRIRIRGGGGLDPSLSCPKPDQDAGEVRSFVGFATEFQNQAYEAAHGAARTNGEIYGGHFTEALLAGLNGGAAQDAGGVQPTELKRYLEQWTPRIAKEAKHPLQKAHVVNELLSYPAEPSLGGAMPTGQLEVHVGADRHGLIKVLDPQNTVVHEADALNGPWQLDLRYGEYRVIEVATDDQVSVDFQPRESKTRVELL